MPVNEIKLKITIDGKEAQASIQLTDKELKNLAASIRQAGEESRPAGSKIVHAFAEARNLIQGFRETMDVMRNLFAEPLQLFVDSEQAEVSFEVMLGSADKARQLLQELRDFGARTPLEFTGLRDNALMLLNFGIAANQVLAKLKMLGDISGGNAEKMRALTLAYAQASSTGRLMGQDLLQMINAGFNPLQIIAEKTGRSIGDLKKEMEQGKITVDLLNDAFETATSEGGRFYNLLEKQSQRAGGTISNFNDALTLLKENAGELVAETITPLLKTGSDIINWLNSTNPLLKKLTLGTGMLTAALITLKVTGIIGTITSLMTWSPAIIAAGASTAGFTGTIAAATGAVKTFFASLGPIGWAVIALGTIAGAWIAIKAATKDAADEQDRYFITFGKTRADLQRSIDQNRKRQTELAIMLFDPLVPEKTRKSIESEIAFLLAQEKQLREKMDRLRIIEPRPVITPTSDKEQQKLLEELSQRSLVGREKELEQLKQKYQREKTIAAGNQELLKMLEEDYNRQILRINIKWDKARAEEQLEFWAKIKEIEEQKLEERKRRFDEKIILRKPEFEKPEPEFIGQPQEKIISENFQTALMYDAIISIDEGFRQAARSAADFGAASAAAWALNSIGIRQTNSLLQVFIARLIQATLQALFLQLAMQASSLLLPGVGGAAQAVASVFGGAEGAIVTKPTFMVVGEGKEPEGVFPLSYLNGLLSGSKTEIRTITDVNLKIEPVEFKQDGMDMRAVLNEVDKHIRNKR